MLDGPAPDIMAGFAPPRVEATKSPQNFTPLPEFKKPTMTEPPKYSEPTDTANVDELMAQIMKEKPKKPQEVVSQIEKEIPQEKKPQGFWAKIKDAIENFFRKLFG
ncbi:hypothetical protein HZA75_02280 [Candidatus Roizmanbacteria bacterium]|nr:hypothetical protein [Candidatus Roizmanbacteria bacterium]